jgi:hypothetical protein
VLLSLLSALFALPFLSFGIFAESPGSGKFYSKPASSTDGFYLLKWHYASSLDAEDEFIIDESLSDDFDDYVSVYTGRDASTSRSGKKDGVYYYRLSLKKSDGTILPLETLSVKVSHHSLDRALKFMALGALVFLITSVMIIAGHLKHIRTGRKEGSESGE